MPGIVAGKSITERLHTLKADWSLLGDGRLVEYLGALVPKLRAVFDGPLTYASLPFEQLDWGPSTTSASTTIERRGSRTATSRCSNRS